MTEDSRSTKEKPDRSRRWGERVTAACTIRAALHGLVRRHRSARPSCSSSRTRRSLRARRRDRQDRGWRPPGRQLAAPPERAVRGRRGTAPFAASPRDGRAGIRVYLTSTSTPGCRREVLEAELIRRVAGRPGPDGGVQAPAGSALCRPEQKAMCSPGSYDYDRPSSSTASAATPTVGREEMKDQHHYPLTTRARRASTRRPPSADSYRAAQGLINPA